MIFRLTFNLVLLMYLRIKIFTINQSWLRADYEHLLFKHYINNFKRKLTVNKDLIEGSIKDAAGKAQQKIGEIVGNPKQQVKGVQKQIKGKTQKTMGNVKEAAKDVDKHS